MFNILNQMYLESEKIYNDNLSRGKDKKIPPIIAVVYNPLDFNVIYIESNKTKSMKHHAERIIFQNILRDKIQEDCKEYNLLITCPPCSTCVNDMNKKNIKFKKIEWLTSFGKDEELSNFRYDGFSTNSTILLKSKEEKMRLIACKRWVDFKYDMNFSELLKLKIIN